MTARRVAVGLFLSSLVIALTLSPRDIGGELLVVCIGLFAGLVALEIGVIVRRRRETRWMRDVDRRC